MMIIAKKLMGGGKTLNYLLAAMIVLCGAQSLLAEDEIVDLGGDTVSKSASDFSAYKDKIIKNGTIKMSGGHISGATPGKYTIGNGATVKDDTSGGPEFNGDWNFNVVDGGFYYQNVASGDHRFIMPMRYGNCTFTLDNGAFTTDSVNSSNNAEPLTLGWIWAYNNDDGKDKDVSMNVVIRNESTLSVPNGNIRIGGTRKSANRKSNTLKVDFAVANSTMNIGKEIFVGCSHDVSNWLNYPENSYVRVMFGPNADITCKQVFANPNPSPSVTFDGATIHWIEGGNCFIGHHENLGDIYTIESNGLTIDIPSGKTLTCDKNSSSLKGEGGITKIGEGSITWNEVSKGGSAGMTFKGPLVVSNGTWTSTLSYGASAFKANGGNLTLSGALSAEEVALEATDGGTLTLSGATITDTAPALTLAGGGTTDYFIRDAKVGTYTLDSLTLGEGAVLDLEADATAIDTIIANTTSITATAENKATININFSALPSPMATFTFFVADSTDKFSVVPKFGSLTLPCETSIIDGKLTLMITADNYTWNGTQTNWGDADAWTKGGASATWADGNNAVFSKSNTEANIAAKVSAAEVRFAADATVSGSETLSVPSISVEQGVIGTIKAPIAGAFEKVGAGMLTLTKPRTDQTTLSEGTLVMSGESATVDYQTLTLGTDATKNVTFDYGGKTLTADPTVYFGAGMDITLANGVYKNSKAIEFTNSTIPSILTVAKGAELCTDDRFKWNTSGEATLNIAGGTVKSVKNNNNWIMQASYTGCLNINVIDGGLLEFGGEVFMLSCRDGNDEYLSPKLNFKVVDSTVRVVNDKSLRLGYDDSTKPSAKPILTLGATNSVFDIAYAIFLGNDKVDLATEGAYTADFENCVITARYFNIYADRPLNAVRFNGTRLVANTSNPILLWTAEAFDTKGEGGTAIKPVTIDEGGLILDTNGKNVQLGADPQGGTLTKDGAGKLTIAKSQTSTGGFVCEEGETILNAGLTMNRTVSVKNGATFTVKSTKQSSVAGLTLEAGSKLNIESYTSGIVPILATAVTLPTEGSAELSMNGGEFTTGTYTILAMNDIAVKDVDGKLRPSTGNASYTWSVSSDNTLVLTVGNPVHGRWRASAAGGDFSSPGNWEDGVVPTAGTIDFSGATADMTVNCGDMREV
ncbi:MAG: hypothetical protein IKZ36_00850, partial [Kiritimatiellae bacterium]|nr:hypothetical protein [Kiritimatiellia bacterium]